MDGPCWDLAIPSPARNCADARIGDTNTPTRNSLGSGGNAYSNMDLMTPVCMKSNLVIDKQSPQSINTKKNGSADNIITSLRNDHESGQLTNFSATGVKMPRWVMTPKVFLSSRDSTNDDLDELNATIYATVDKNHETYVCMHELVEYVSKKVLISSAPIKWRHENDQTFLFVIQDKPTRDRFLNSHASVSIGDTIVKFKPWKPTVGSKKSPCLFKVWLRLTGLPIEHFTFRAAEVVVSRFGRLHRCNFEKKKVYVGCFYVMIDCPDVDNISPSVDVQLDTDGEIPVFVEKMYACQLDVYNAQMFDDRIIGMMTYCQR